MSANNDFYIKIKKKLFKCIIFLYRNVFVFAKCVFSCYMLITCKHL